MRKLCLLGVQFILMTEEVGIFKHKCKKIDVKGQVVNDISLFFFLVIF